MDEEIEPDSIAIIVVRWEFAENLGLFEVLIPFLWGPSVTSEQVSRVIYMAMFPLVVIYVGRLARPVVNIENDVSYGVYIYGWPIAQALVYFAIQRQITFSPVTYFALTMALTLPIAFASWRLVEKPSLSLKRLFVRSKRIGLKSQEGSV